VPLVLVLLMSPIACFDNTAICFSFPVSWTRIDFKVISCYVLLYVIAFELHSFNLGREDE